MALKKSDLYRSLWQSCDELRGGMDASQYKDYILTLLFVKYVSDKAKSDPDSLIDVPDGGGFDALLALKGSPEIGEGFDKAIAKLAEANELHGVIDVASFNDPEKLGSGKEMQDRLSKLVAIFADLDFRGSRAEGDDLLGDAYEYLMRHFATESGKSKGQFYTPAEVSRVMAKIVGIDEHTKQDQTVYDPTCGSGSLLLKAASEAPRGITIYGQEKDNATWALSRMNMILHDNVDADIAKGDTITNPKFVAGTKLRTFDFFVANPPFSSKSWSNGLEEDYGRFEYGMPPPKNGDYAFLLHALKSLKSTGKGVIVMPHGVLFRGNAEADIRRSLLKHGFIKGIIGLPTNLFYGTGIPACLVVLDKEGARDERPVFMIDASKGFVKDGAKNRLRSRDIHKIVDVFNRRTEVERYSREVPYAEIANHNFNLSIPRYVDSSEPDDVQDLSAHLQGGIPNRDINALHPFWEAFPALRAQLFAEGRAGYSDISVDILRLEQVIRGSRDFQPFVDDLRSRVDTWFDVHRDALGSINPDTKPSDLIAVLGDDLLARFRDVPLLDPYDVYEQLLSYWHATMHDDVFLVMKDGWVDASKPRHPIVDKQRKLTETPDLTVGTGRTTTKYKMDLVPPAVVANRYFDVQVAAADELETSYAVASAAVEEYIDEHAVEDGLLWEAVEDDKVTKPMAAARLREARKLSADAEEIEALEHVISLFNAESDAKKAAKDARADLDAAVLERYRDLSESVVKSLVLDEKWHATVATRIGERLTTLVSSLVARVGELADRYGYTASELDDALVALAERIRPLEAGLEEGLLTGRTRLAGFEGPWDEVRLGDAADFSKGRGLSKSALVQSGSYPCIHYGELFTHYGADITSVTSRTNAEGQHAKTKPGDVLMPTSDVTPRGLAKASAVHCAGVIIGGDILVIRPDPQRLSSSFLARAIRQDALQVLRLVRGSTVYHLYAHDMATFTFRAPSLEEQEAISQVLRDSDAQIELLDRRLAKAKAIKEGIAQQLLTDRVSHLDLETVA